jgi:predicted CoA-substrate-specific enzyme activase
MRQLLVGLDVGSTTVKAVVVDAATDVTLWQDYQRHETRQPEKVLEFLSRMEADAGISTDNTRIFITGSGGGPITEMIGGKFVQEVHAVALAVEKLHSEVYSVIELGGQDAKIIVFKDDEETGRKKKIPSMNDECAGGTGAVIDKINSKLKIPTTELANQGYHGVKLHKVAGKCGVFAETDINGLQKTGTPSDELMASLFEAIVLQNLSVLTRGNTLRPHVLLLGGPNSFIRGMREAWQANIPRMWKERKVQIPEGATPEELIKVPQNAQYFAALGAVEFGRDEEQQVGRYLGVEKLAWYIDYGRAEEKAIAGGKGLVTDIAELEDFRSAFRRKKFDAAEFNPGELISGFVGVDGGSTSTKAVLLDKDGEIFCKAYQLSNGNPIEDTIDMFEKLRKQVESRGAALEVLGVGTTGYAKDILRDVLNADVALVETVAHTESALKFYKDPHVIIDVGGQDMKLIVLKDGRVKDFKLNTQCSAGNGYFLQSTAEGFGMKVEEFADIAFSAKSMPSFGYGCAVFMQSDIVNFQRQGWRSEEILAGLADVLPKNVFLYVASIPNLASLGTRFVLQGGTQNNLAVVKAEVDFIRSSFRANGKEPEIIVHEHCGESGAIGAAQEALRLWRRGKATTFMGLDAVRKIRYRTTRNEDTRCYFCKNNCLPLLSTWMCRERIRRNWSRRTRRKIVLLRPKKWPRSSAICPASRRSRQTFQPPRTVQLAAPAALTSTPGADAVRLRTRPSAQRRSRSFRFRLRPEQRKRWSLPNRPESSSRARPRSRCVSESSG